MKKFALALALLFIVNMGCKKMNIDGGGLCGCSPISGPRLNLVIRNAAGDDLLSSNTTGAFTKDKIQFFRKDSEGKMTTVLFGIREPLSYGDEKFRYNTLTVSDLRYTNDSSKDMIYLKLGDNQPYEISLELKLMGQYSVQKIFIDQKEAEKDTGNVSKYESVFYLYK